MDVALTPSLIRSAYANGWFPMADEEGAISWYEPRMRALFPIEGIHVSRSLAKRIRKCEFEVRFDSAFEQVVRNCRRPFDNWISEEIVLAYTAIHREGWAHCAECWREGELVGGVYGLAIGACFSAESMFHRCTDASKVALWALVERCRELGFTLFDAQVMNPHLQRLGAVEIPAEEYRHRLHVALRFPTPWGPGYWVSEGR